MKRYILRRTAEAVPVVLGVTAVVFFLLHLVPGDPVDMMLGESATALQREELRSKLGLTEPLRVQFGRYLAGLARGDLGASIFSGEPVLGRIARAYPATLELAGAALLVALMVALPAGVLAAAKRGGLWDGAAIATTLVGLSMPAFWLGPLLILAFAFHLDWFPISGREEPFSVVLPAITLGTGMAAILARMTRATLADLFAEPFVRTAWAKGLSARAVWWKHLLANALLPLVTIAGLQAGALLAGSIITEKVFSWPGLGTELVEAIERRDYPVVQGCVLAISLSYVLINLLTDLAYGWIDPRVRLAGGRR